MLLALTFFRTAPSRRLNLQTWPQSAMILLSGCLWIEMMLMTKSLPVRLSPSFTIRNWMQEMPMENSLDGNGIFARQLWAFSCSAASRVP